MAATLTARRLTYRITTHTTPEHPRAHLQTWGADRDITLPDLLDILTRVEATDDPLELRRLADAADDVSEVAGLDAQVIGHQTRMAELARLAAERGVPHKVGVMYCYDPRESCYGRECKIDSSWTLTDGQRATAVEIEAAAEAAGKVAAREASSRVRQADAVRDYAYGREMLVAGRAIAG